LGLNKFTSLSISDSTVSWKLDHPSWPQNTEQIAPNWTALVQHHSGKWAHIELTVQSLSTTGYQAWIPRRHLPLTAETDV